MLIKIAKKTIIWILTLEARLILAKYKPSIIAVTGSVGKTGTKDAIYACVSGHVFSAKSAKSYNSEVGIPLTIIGSRSAWNNPLGWIRNIIKGLALILLKSHYPKWLIIEAGVDRPGDMARLVKWLKPDIAVFTKFNAVPPHIEYFKNKDELYKEKWLLAQAVKQNGHVVINGDDEQILSFANGKIDSEHLHTFGIAEQNKIRGSHYKVTYEKNSVYKRPKGFTFHVNTEGKSVPITINGTLGFGYMYCALAGIACGIIAGANLVSISAALGELKTSPGRMRILRGAKDTTIIDDSYNSSPDAVILAIDVLSKIETSGRKILVLGDMLELGDLTMESHKSIGTKIGDDISLIYLVGRRARFIAEGIRGAKRGRVHYFNNTTETSEAIAAEVAENDVILVKGSQGIRLEKIVERLLEDPNKKEGLLVRQEKEWATR